MFLSNTFKGIKRINYFFPSLSSSSLSSSLFCSSRTFSTTTINTTTTTTNEKEKEKKTVALYFQDLVYRGRKENILSIRELKKLMKLCSQPNDIKYSGLAVDWFQKKGYDFSEELNSLFVKLCVDSNKPEIAAERFVEKKGRIGSWSTPSTIYKLFASLQSKKRYNFIIDIAHVVIPKGVRPNIRSFEIIFDALTQVNSTEKYDTTVVLAKTLLTEEEIIQLQEKYPKPTTSE